MLSLVYIQIHVHLFNVQQIIRIFHGCEVRIEKSVRWVTVWHHEALPKAEWCQTVISKERIFLSAPNNHDRFFFLHTFWSQAFDFNLGVAIDMSLSLKLPSAIMKVDVCDVAMTSTPNFLTTELRDLLYNQCIDNACCYSFFIYPMGQIRVCKINRTHHWCSVETGKSQPEGPPFQ